MQSNLAGPDYYTRAILGEKITLVLGKPVSGPLALVPRPAAPANGSVSRPAAQEGMPRTAERSADVEPSGVNVVKAAEPPTASTSKIASAEQRTSAPTASNRTGSVLRWASNMPQWARVAGFAIAVPTIVFVGAWGARSVEGLIFGDPLPGISAKPSSVRVVDQEYKGPTTAPAPGGPLPIAGQATEEAATAAPAATGGPLPVPMSKGVPDVVPAPSLPLDVLTRAPAAPLAALPGKTDKKEQPPALVVDDGASKATAAPAPAPKAPAAVSPAQPPAPAAKPPTAVAPAPASRQAAVPTGPVKLAQPVEERAAQPAQPAKAGAAPSAAPVAPANEARITIVDIVPGGKAVLVTNPATRLPQRVAVGEKLPNGRTVQSIDEKAGSVTADGATYKIE